MGALGLPISVNQLTYKNPSVTYHWNATYSLLVLNRRGAMP
jgi:hypothetical protein